MKTRQFAKFLVGTAICAIATSSFAQFGLPSLPGMGGKPAGGNAGVTAEQLVSKYVNGMKSVMSADVNMLQALGLKEQADKEALQLKNLTEGATSAALEDSAKIQTESSKAIGEQMEGKKVVLSADSKKQFAVGLIDLVKGVKNYIDMASDVKGFKPSITSIGSTAGAAIFIVKSLPDNITNLTSSISRAVSFSKDNDIPVPADATSLLK